MSAEHPTPHPTADRLQDWLDGRLPEPERAAIAAHVDGCPLCRDEVEGWETLWADLSSLSTLAPGPALASRVMESVRTEPAPEVESPRLGIAARIAGWIGPIGRSGRGGTPAPAHPDAGLVQDLLSGALDARLAARVRTHVEGCARCASEARTWSAVFERLDALPRLSPSEGFADGVMARLRREADAEPASRGARLGRRIASGIGSALGRDAGRRRAWAAMAGVALTPATVLALLAYAVFSHPLVTAESLAEFIWLKRGSLADALSGGLTRDPATSGVWSWLDAMTRSPGMAVTGLLLLTALTAGAAWVLYRNVVSPSARPVHAHARR